MTERELFHDAVMQYMVDDARIAKESKRRKPHPIARRILFAAACILVALGVTVFSIPSARAAALRLPSSQIRRYTCAAITLSITPPSSARFMKLSISYFRNSIK